MNKKVNKEMNEKSLDDSDAEQEEIIVPCNFSLYKCMYNQQLCSILQNKNREECDFRAALKGWLHLVSSFHQSPQP